MAFDMSQVLRAKVYEHRLVYKGLVNAVLAGGTLPGSLPQDHFLPNYVFLAIPSPAFLSKQ